MKRLLWLLVCILASPLYAQEITLDRINTALIDQGGKPFSGNILIAKDSVITFNYPPDNPDISLNWNSRIAVGTLGKQILSVLILREYEKGKIDLIAPISTYLPKLPSPWSDKVTVRHLLTNTHGITAVDQPLNFTPGTRYEYSAIGYQLLGNILEKANKELYVNITEQLFREYGMVNTFHPNSFHGGKAAKEFMPEQPEVTSVINDKSVYLPELGYITTPKDLHIWNSCLYGNKILKPETLRIMFSWKQEDDKGNPAHGAIHYGHGLNADSSGLPTDTDQTGYVPEYVAMNIFFPESFTSTIVLQHARYGDTPEDLLVYPSRMLEIIKDNKDALEQRIRTIIKDKNATIGVAVIYDAKDTLVINNDVQYPMQSVYKFHMALTVADCLYTNQFPLNTEIYVKNQDLLPDTYSPLRDRYPHGEFYMSIPELIRYSVSFSDNNACDILFAFAGGTSRVEQYIKRLGIRNISIKATEAEMHANPELQYQNWTTPLAAAEVMDIFLDEFLFPESHRQCIMDALIQSPTGSDKLKGLLPEGTTVGHKTGSGTRDSNGMKSADNDLGFVTLPNGRQYTIAVFIKDSMESDQENAAIIAAISKEVYDYYSRTNSEL